MEYMDKRLAFIILDVVAIIAILGIVLLADLSEQQERNTFQKLILGGNVVKKIGINPEQWPENMDPCDAIRCKYGPVNFTGITETNHALCECPNGDVYQISKIKYYAGNYQTEP